MVGKYSYLRGITLAGVKAIAKHKQLEQASAGYIALQSNRPGYLYDIAILISCMWTTCKE
jgi:hypothetical protein